MLIHPSESSPGKTFQAICRKRYVIFNLVLYKVQSNVCETNISYDSFQLYANEIFYLVLSIVADWYCVSVWIWNHKTEFRLIKLQAISNNMGNQFLLCHVTDAIIAIKMWLFVWNCRLFVILVSLSKLFDIFHFS